MVLGKVQELVITFILFVIQDFVLFYSPLQSRENILMKCD